MKRVDDSRFDAQRAAWQCAGINADSSIWSADLSVRAYGAAQNCKGVPDALRELAARPVSELKRLRNCGAFTLAELTALLTFCGLSWAPEPPKVRCPRLKVRADDIKRLSAAAHMHRESVRAVLRCERTDPWAVQHVTRTAQELGIVLVYSPSPKDPP